MLFELIQVALGQRETLSHALTAEEWKRLYRDAVKQSVAGVAFEGVKKLPKEQKPSEELFFPWFGATEQIAGGNRLANQRTVEVTKLFSDAGFRSCILKGQGNATMYPNPFSRMPGDIDIWIDADRKVICDFVKSKAPHAREVEKHIVFPIFQDVKVEVHYTPSILIIPKYNKRLQFFFKTLADAQFRHQLALPGTNDQVCIPIPAFNVAYQMAHIMNHFFYEGIGLKQFVDYYYVLQNAKDVYGHEEIRKQFEYLGMLKFSKGVMWIEKECLKLGDQNLLVEPDAKIGRVILAEMIEGGNFGRYDARYAFRKKGYLAKGLTNAYRLFKLASVFPMESIWKIYRKLENQKWKLP